MEMSSSIISDIRLFVRRQDLLPIVKGGAVRLQFYRYGLIDLASPDRLWILSPSCCKEGYPYNIYPNYYIFDNGDSYFRLPSNVDKVVWMLFTKILVLELFPMLHDNGYARARSVGIVAQIRKGRTIASIFTFMV
jgi:hypothetical protein